MFKVSLKKIWSSIFDHIVKWILGIILTGILVVFKDWIWKHLKTTHTADFPLWGWITIIAIIAGVTLFVVLIVEWLRKSKAPPATSTEKLLTDPGDITNKLIWWLGQQRGFVFTRTKCRQPVVWHFSRIDEELNLTPGSSKEYLPKILNSNDSPFPAIVENLSSDTIRLKYDFSPFEIRG